MRRHCARWSGRVAVHREVSAKRRLLVCRRDTVGDPTGRGCRSGADT